MNNTAELTDKTDNVGSGESHSLGSLRPGDLRLQTHPMLFVRVARRLLAA